LVYLFASITYGIFGDSGLSALSGDATVTIRRAA
jgi:hypothetical protein